VHAIPVKRGSSGRVPINIGTLSVVVASKRRRRDKSLLYSISAAKASLPESLKREKEREEVNSLIFLRVWKRVGD